MSLDSCWVGKAFDHCPLTKKADWPSDISGCDSEKDALNVLDVLHMGSYLKKWTKQHTFDGPRMLWVNSVRSFRVCSLLKRVKKQSKYIIQTRGFVAIVAEVCSLLSPSGWRSALFVSVRLLINIHNLWVWCWKDLRRAERRRAVSLCV